MARIQQVPINPDVLSWAIRTSGLDDRAVASRLKVDVNTVGKWLSGTDRPIISKFRSLVKVLRRSSAIFFLPRPPQSSLIEIQFRQAPGGSISKSLSRGKNHGQRRGTSPANPQMASERAKGLWSAVARDNSCYRRRASCAASSKLLQVSNEEQFKWSSNSQALKEWRSQFEENGILVFLMSIGAKGARGFSIWDETTPLIAVNTHWNPAARIYTLFHELGHLLTRTSSICTNYSIGKNSKVDTDVER